MTPIQIASLYATIANGGKIWRPYILEKVTNYLGETIEAFSPELIKEAKSITPAAFKQIRHTLTEVVMNPQGTGRRANLAEQPMAGKTGSVQVVSLKKSRGRKDESAVSMKWQEHAVFAGFSPPENAEVVVAVISENDREGGGGVAAAPIGGQIIKAYWELKKSRQKTPPLIATTPRSSPL
jgi:penicillin-binding protein 2